MDNVDARSLSLPLSEADARALAVGDFVVLNGPLFTARDAVHRHLALGGTSPGNLEGAAFYHCGPVMIRAGDSWEVTAAGPTTSIREEPYMPDLIERFGLRAIIGKGGMGPDTLAACRRHGCIYLHTVGGAAQVLAQRIVAVTGVSLLDEFGAPEAIWELQVRAFPAIVTMDAHGNSLHADVLAASFERFRELLEDRFQPAPTPHAT